MSKSVWERFEPFDCFLHILVAVAFTAIGWAFGRYVLHAGWLVWVFAAIAIVVFGVREGYQQTKKNVPPDNPWFPWQWGSNGIIEWTCVIPFVIAAAAFLP